jgi:hypothetical protein
VRERDAAGQFVAVAVEQSAVHVDVDSAEADAE